MEARCQIPACDRPHRSRGYCSPHYDRWLRTGDAQPDVPIRPGTGPKGIDTNHVHDVLVAYIREHGYAPSLRELGKLVALDSPSSVKHHVDQLEHQGLIERVGPRAIRILT